MRPTKRSAAFLLLTFGLLSPFGAFADEAAILDGIRAFFRSTNTAERVVIAAQIASDPDFDVRKVHDWLHAAKLFEPQDAGMQWIDVPLVDGSSRRVLVRVPANYDPSRPWPLIYILHGMGGNAAGIMRYYEDLLGEGADKFLIAAPDQYQEMIIYHFEWPPVGEHSTVRRALRERFHVDADHVYLSGYSKGGHTTWMQALLHADEFAGALSLAGTFVMVEVDALWETFLPNLANTHFYGVWGSEDTLNKQGEKAKEGGIAHLNRELKTLAEKMKLPISMTELDGVGHGGVVPPSDVVDAWLSQRREHYPKSFQHVFRHEYQGSAYWIESNAWAGEHWGAKLPAIHMRDDENPDDPEDVRQASARAYRGLLGEIRGEVNGQEVRAYRKRIKEITIWFGDDLIDWDQPVEIKANGRKIFEGKLERSLYVCLSQAARTWDFDRLRWAGVRYRSGSKAKLVDVDTEFPDLLKAAQAE